MKPGAGSASGTPRWVKAFGIVFLVMVALLAILLLLRGPGGHDPSRHTSSGDTPTPAVAGDHALISGSGDAAPLDGGHT